MVQFGVTAKIKKDNWVTVIPSLKENHV